MGEGEKGKPIVFFDGAEGITNSTIPSLIGFQQTQLLFFNRPLQSIPVGIPFDKNAIKGIF